MEEVVWADFMVFVWDFTVTARGRPADFGGCGLFFTNGLMVEVCGRRWVWVVFSPQKD
jgi:hypothetical protein